MRSFTTRRLNWLLFPLLVIAWMAAPEWPARAGMMDNPWREGWLPLASAWAGTHPVATATEAATTPLPRPMGDHPLLADLSTSTPATGQLPRTAGAAGATKEKLEPGSALSNDPSSPTGGTVLMLGDSLMGEVAAGLRQHLDRSFRVVDRHKSSTGLTNVGYYDWPATARAATTETQPAWVVVHMGANDAQDMLLEGRFARFGSPAWQDAYLARAQAMLQHIQQAAPGAKVVWVGLPAMRSEAFNARMDIIRQLQKKAAESQSISYLDGHAALGPDYSKDGIVGGRREILRAGDGIHYSRAGGAQLAHEAAGAPGFSLPWKTPGT